MTYSAVFSGANNPSPHSPHKPQHQPGSEGVGKRLWARLRKTLGLTHVPETHRMMAVGRA